MTCIVKPVNFSNIYPVRSKRKKIVTIIGLMKLFPFIYQMFERVCGNQTLERLPKLVSFVCSVSLLTLDHIDIKVFFDVTKHCQVGWHVPFSIWLTIENVSNCLHFTPSCCCCCCLVWFGLVRIGSTITTNRRKLNIKVPTDSYQSDDLVHKVFCYFFTVN